MILVECPKPAGLDIIIAPKPDCPWCHVRAWMHSAGQGYWLCKRCRKWFKETEETGGRDAQNS